MMLKIKIIQIVNGNREEKGIRQCEPGSDKVRTEETLSKLYHCTGVIVKPDGVLFSSETLEAGNEYEFEYELPQPSLLFEYECDITRQEFKEDPTLRDKKDDRLCDKCKHPVSSHPKGEAISAPKQGSLRITTFEDLLRIGCPDFNPHVVSRARRRFSSQIFLAIAEHNVDSAIQVYEQTMALPQTATEMMLGIEGFQLNGPWHAGNDNTIICYKGTVPHLLKALTQKEITRSSALLETLKEQTKKRTDNETEEDASVNSNPFLTPFQLRHHDNKVFMIMPYFPSTLEGIKKLTLVDGIRLFNQMRNALDYLHSLNYNHMDIKPANICLRENGDFVLIDLGSVVMKSGTSESTVAYIPRDFQPRDKRTPNSKYKAVDFNDWLMQGMTIAEKVYGLEIGGSAPPPTTEELTAILRTDGAFEELIALFH